MAQVSVFDYHPGGSFLHRLDVRVKLFVFIILNLSVARSGDLALAILSGVLVLMLVYLRIPIILMLHEIRLFLLMLLLVFFARSFSEPGSPLFSTWRSGVTVEGVIAGGFVCWRLFLIVLLGLFFIRTSRPIAIKAGIYWFLKFIPRLPAHRISLMISLMFRFVPMIMELVSELSEAQQARAVGLRKNPFYRLKVLVIPLMENTFRKADEMILAMEARSYSDSRTDPELRSRREDWLVFTLATVFSSGMVML